MFSRFDHLLGNLNSFVLIRLGCRVRNARHFYILVCLVGQPDNSQSGRLCISQNTANPILVDVDSSFRSRAELRETMEEKTPHDFLGLCQAIGYVVVHWALIEQQVDNWVNVSFINCGGSSLRGQEDSC
jgi:hypothetical protein